MSEIVAGVALPVFAFYMLIAANFIKETLGCSLQTVLETNMYAKHTVGFILLFFLVVMVNPEYADKNIVRNLITSVGIYIWFMITTRTPFYIMISVLLLLLASYIASIAKARNETEKKEKDAEIAANWQNWLAKGALALSIFGFIIYAIEKKFEYKSEFNWFKFFSGNIECRKYTQMSARLI
jgi:hypothetical protein